MHLIEATTLQALDVRSKLPNGFDAALASKALGDRATYIKNVGDRLGDKYDDPSFTVKLQNYVNTGRNNLESQGFGTTSLESNAGTILRRKALNAAFHHASATILKATNSEGKITREAFENAIADLPEGHQKAATELFTKVSKYKGGTIDADDLRDFGKLVLQYVKWDDSFKTFSKGPTEGGETSAPEVNLGSNPLLAQQLALRASLPADFQAVYATTPDGEKGRYIASQVNQVNKRNLIQINAAQVANYAQNNLLTVNGLGKADKAKSTSLSNKYLAYAGERANFVILEMYGQKFAITGLKVDMNEVKNFGGVVSSFKANITAKSLNGLPVLEVTSQTLINFPFIQPPTN